MNDHNIFYIPPHFFSGNEVTLQNPELHHIKKVLRKKVGERICLTDGKGYCFEAEITDLSKSLMKVRVLHKRRLPRKCPIEITVAFVPVKGLRNDTIIEKGTELGVKRFVTFVSKRSVIKDLSKQKIERFKKIAASALAQSQQYYMPEVLVEKSLETLLANSEEYDYVLLADPRGKSEVPLGGRRILLMIGPEGGFADSEMDTCMQSGAQLLSLGPTRLRTETAAIVGVSKILAAYGLI
jgi:16S rRNA (uracil1498-N3)-methyltransferase